ncbi:hypothetical protein AB8B21_05770 [Tardiphaga sp. 866_E4_N2_1]|uniref:hypothetical protein n=1 Tax=unclassified Tardiphaga TaxID=2631404 RepID=UPI003F252E04
MKALRFLRALPLAAIALALTLGGTNQSPAAQGTGCLPTTGTVSGLTFAQGVNAAVAALISSNSGATAPATDCSAVAIKGQVWLDTSVTPNVFKQYDGTSWVALGALDSTNHLWAPPVGGGTASVTAASTTDICAAPSAVQTINGTTPITSFGSACVVGARKTLVFSSATPITYNATSLILPAQRNYTAAAGDAAEAIYLGSGNWRVLTINKADGSSVTNPSVPIGTTLFGEWGTIPAKTVYKVGQALPRASYPDYLAAMTRVQTGTLTSGSATITSVPNTEGLGAGMPIEGTGIPAGTTIASVTSSTIVMTSPNTATVTGSQTVTAFITGYGTGGDSTTVGVTDCRGRTMAGRDDMIFGAANVLTSTYFGTATSRIGAKGGSQSHAQTIAEMAAHDHSNTLSLSTGTTTYDKATTGSANLAAGGNAVPIVNGAVATPLAGVLSGGVVIDSKGSGAASPIVQPTQIAECVVVVLP